MTGIQKNASLKRNANFLLKMYVLLVMILLRRSSKVKKSQKIQKNVVANNKDEYEERIQILNVDIKALEKQIKSSEILVKNLEKKNDVLENSLKQFKENIEGKMEKKYRSENKKLEDEIVRLKNEAEIQKISFEKAIFDVENNYKNAIKEALKNHIEANNSNMENCVDISCQTVETHQIGNKEDKSNFGSETAETAPTKLKIKKKITKKVIEESLIDAFEKDVDVMYTDLENSGLDVYSQRCKKCDHKTHSEGHLRQHKVANHNSKETKQNIILGYEIDMQRHATVLECMEDGLDKFKCEECSFKTHSEGKFTLHKLTNHQG